MVIQAVTFRKKHNSPVEVGIRIEAGRDWIIDSDGKEVKQVHDYKIHQYDLTIDIHPILKNLKEKFN